MWFWVDGVLGTLRRASDVSSYLGGLPLALEQAAAYVPGRPGTTFADLLSRLHNDLNGALATKPADHPVPAHRAFLASLEAAKLAHPRADWLLLLLSYADPDTLVPLTLLTHAADESVVDATRNDVSDALFALPRYSVIQWDD